VAQTAIFDPVFAMIALTFLVWTYMYARRIPFIQSLDPNVAIFRALHSAVHCTVNAIPVRFALYSVSTLAVWFIAARAALRHLAS
jgi:hypothetical protein